MSAGMMYIANSFKTVGRTAAERGRWPVDNDPHFWSSPPTWGICRPDLRKKAKDGQTIFFVLSKYAQYPQMVFGYMKIDKVVSHLAAFRLLRHKRMRGASPDGNIIVNATGRYNAWDAWAHHHNFEKIRGKYAIGDPKHSRFLTADQITAKAPLFIPKLREVFGGSGNRAIDFITRAGKHTLAPNEVEALRRWIDAGLPRDDRGFGGDSKPGGGRGPRPPSRHPSVCGPGGVCVPRSRSRTSNLCGSVTRVGGCG